jgi:hypothetical protein
LKVHVVFREVSALNRIIEVLDVVIGVFTSETECLIGFEVLDSGFRLDVPFDVYKGAILLAELICVDAKSVDVAELDVLLAPCTSDALRRHFLLKQEYHGDRRGASKHEYLPGC